MDGELLPCVSNEVYRVGPYVVRLPTRPRVGVDHRTEIANAELAATAGIGAEIVFARDDGALVTMALDGHALCPADLRTDPADRDRFLRCKPWCDLFWSLWSLAEHAAGNAADDFVAEAERRTARGLRYLNA